jgi:RNA polymerase sigma factor (sigma-70 family)
MGWRRSRVSYDGETGSTAVAAVDPVADDAVLVTAALRDRQAFRFLYERHFQQIYRYCYLKLASRELAEDATSEVFVKAMTRLDTWHGHGPFAGWLFRIAQNVVADTAWKHRAARRGVPIDVAHEIADPATPPDERAVAGSVIDAIRAALPDLPDNQRTLVELQIAGLSTQEIAAALGRSDGAVRMLRLRAFQQLRDVLAAAGLDPDESGDW